MTLWESFNAAGKAVLDNADQLAADNAAQIATLTDSLTAANARIVQLDAENVALRGELAKYTGEAKPVPTPDAGV